MPTKLTPPAVLTPPFPQPMLDANGIVVPIWQAWFTAVSATPTLLTGGGVIMQTGTSTSDGGGGISVTLPMPFTVRTLSFDVGGIPRAVYVPVDPFAPLPLDVIAGILGEDDGTGTGTVIPAPNTDFTWYATGI